MRFTIIGMIVLLAGCEMAAPADEMAAAAPPPADTLPGECVPTERLVELFGAQQVISEGCDGSPMRLATPADIARLSGA